MIQKTNHLSKLALITLALGLVTQFAHAQNQTGQARPGEAAFVGQVEKNDSDGNGKLSFKEASVERMFRKTLFDAIDVNNDGEISRQEAVKADKIDISQGPKKRIEFEGKQWVADHAFGASVVNYKGKKALHIAGREQTYVYLPVDFGDGVIEVDIAGDTMSGIGFRGRENGTRVEKPYFRPQMANTERANMTVQYSVMGREDGHWRTLSDSSPGTYQAAANIKKGEWFHAKLVIKGDTLKMYIDDAPEPVLVVDPLLDGESRGSIGVWGWESYFANFKYTPSD